MDIERIGAVANAEMATRRDVETREPGWSGHHGQTFDDRIAWLEGDEMQRYYDHVRTTEGI